MFYSVYLSIDFAAVIPTCSSILYFLLICSLIPYRQNFLWFSSDPAALPFFICDRILVSALTIVHCSCIYRNDFSLYIKWIFSFVVFLKLLNTIYDLRYSICRQLWHSVKSLQIVKCILSAKLNLAIQTNPNTLTEIVLPMINNFKRLFWGCSNLNPEERWLIIINYPSLNLLGERLWYLALLWNEQYKM